MRKRKDRRRLAENLFSDPWRKLLAFGLAVLLWLYLDSQVTTSVDHTARLTPVGADGLTTALPSAAQIHVALPLTTYSLLQFWDPIREERIEQIELTLEGPRYLIERLTENPGLTVLPVERESRTTGDVRIYEFDRTRVQSRFADFGQLVRAMNPRQVEIHLEPNRGLPIPATRFMVTFDQSLRHLEEARRQQLLNATYAFEPITILVRGPGKVIDDVERTLARGEAAEPIFVASWQEAVPKDRNEWMFPLRLQPALVDRGLVFDNMSPVLIVKLAAEMQLYELPVRVVVDASAIGADAADFVVEPPEITVRLSAAGVIGSELNVASEANQVPQWVSRHLRVLAPLLPGNSDGDGGNVTPYATIYYDADLKEGVDYMIAPLNPVTIRRKK